MIKMNKEPLEELRNKISKEPYGLPSSYFDKLPVRISERVGESSSEKVFLSPTWMKWVSLAASIVLITVLWFQPFRGPSEEGSPNLEDQLFWSLYSSDVSIDAFFYNQPFDHSIMDELILDETASFAFEEEYGYDPNWDF